MRAFADHDRGLPHARLMAPSGLPRLLDGCPSQGFMPLDEHLDRYGLLPGGSSKRDRAVLLHEVERSGLRGRGGSGFPTARKMRAVADGRGPRVVVANGMEGEPASSKDAVLLARLPHLVLDGVALAARAVGARQALLAIERSATESYRHLMAAVEERRLLPDAVPVTVVTAPSRYVAGEESALVNFLNGGDAKPTSVPPRPFERGVGGRPTLIQNVETLAHLAQIGRFGADWYRELGSPDDPGSTLLTVSGAVARPGVLEVPLSITLGDVVAAAGGPTSDVGAFLVGGYFGTWLDAGTSSSLSLCAGELRAREASLGCGVIHVLPADACGLAASARVARYLAEESAGQCGPCVYGLAAVADAMDDLAHGGSSDRDVNQLHRWLEEIVGRGACRLPDGTTRFVASALKVFAPEIKRHHQHRRCLAGTPSLLPLPRHRDWSWR